MTQKIIDMLVPFRCWLFLSLFLALMVGSCRPSGTPAHSPTSATTPHPGTFQTIKKQYPGSQIDGYNLYVPNSCTATAEPFPVIVFLQGGLGVGGDVSTVLRWALPQMVQESSRLDTELDQLQRNTFVYIMPHLTHGDFYNNVEVIQAIIEEVLNQYNTDENRIYLTGLSRGGHGVWGLASKIPGTFAAIVPIAGATHGVRDYEALTKLPIWVIHNKGDAVVDHYRSDLAVRRIEKRTGKTFHRSSSVAATAYQDYDLIFTSSENPAEPHDAWTATYSSVNFYQWLLRFEREALPAN
jgi:predicted peptidase